MSKFLFVASLVIMGTIGAHFWIDAAHGLKSYSRGLSHTLECGLTAHKVYWTQC